MSARGQGVRAWRSPGSPTRAIEAHRRLLRICSLVAVALAPGLRAQDESPRKFELPPPRYSIGADGRLGIAVGADAPFVPVDGLGADTVERLQFLSSMLLVCAGDSDLASLTDAVNFFERREGGEDVGILRTLARRPQEGDGSHHDLLRILAVRAAERTGLKPAIGLIKRTLQEKDLDQDLREACEDAMAGLNGDPRPVRVREVVSLEESLADVPAEAGAVICVNNSTMPPSGALQAFFRRSSERASDRAMEIYGENPEIAAQIQRGTRVTAITANIGYVLAQRIGNARIHRLVLAMKFKERFETVPDFFIRIDGEWDLARVAQFVRDQHMIVEGDDHAITVGGIPDYSVRLTSRCALFSHKRFREPGGKEHARELLGHLRPDASVSMWLSDSAPYPEGAGIFRIASAWMVFPRTQVESVHIHTDWATPAASAAVAGWTAGLGRLLGGLADRQEALEPIAEAASAIKVTREGRAVDFEVPLPKGDLIELAEKLNAMSR